MWSVRLTAGMWEDTSLHRVSRLISVPLPAGVRGMTLRAGGGRAKSEQKCGLPPPAVSAQHLLLLTFLLTKVGRFRPYIASKGID